LRSQQGAAPWDFFGDEEVKLPYSTKEVLDALKGSEDLRNGWMDGWIDGWIFQNLLRVDIILILSDSSVEGVAS